MAQVYCGLLKTVNNLFTVSALNLKRYYHYYGEQFTNLLFTADIALVNHRENLLRKSHIIFDGKKLESILKNFYELN